FMANTTLPDLPTRRTSNAYLMCGEKKYTRCEAPIRLELPDGQKLLFEPRPSAGNCYGTPYAIDRRALDRMPALETAYQREAQGDSPNWRSRARLRTRTLTRGSPRKPSWRPSVRSSTIRWTRSGRVPGLRDAR